LRYVWFRAKGQILGGQTIHQRLLAYASDYNLLTTAIQPHQHEVQIHQLQLASLDHAMWFHRPVDLSKWLLYEIDSPSASNARGFTRGSIYQQDGTLVASVVQEGLIRPKRKK
jgi:acyl-CoA thioesterase-2